MDRISSLKLDGNDKKGKLINYVILPPTVEAVGNRWTTGDEDNQDDGVRFYRDTERLHTNDETSNDLYMYPHDELEPKQEQEQEQEPGAYMYIILFIWGVVGTLCTIWSCCINRFRKMDFSKNCCTKLCGQLIQATDCFDPHTRVRPYPSDQKEGCDKKVKWFLTDKVKWWLIEFCDTFCCGWLIRCCFRLFCKEDTCGSFFESQYKEIKWCSCNNKVRKKYEYGGNYYTEGKTSWEAERKKLLYGRRDEAVANFNYQAARHQFLPKRKKEKKLSKDGNKDIT